MSKIPGSVLAKNLKDLDVEPIQDRIESNSTLIDEIVNKLVADYCKPLDDYVRQIQFIISDTANPVTDEELDDFVMNLPVFLYFAGESQEALGIREDVAKAIRAELYNSTFDKSEGTVAAKTAVAELACQTETVIQIAYSRAYKKVKLRMEIGNELLQSIKKVVTRRTEACKLSGVDGGRINGSIR